MAARRHHTADALFTLTGVTLTGVTLTGLTSGSASRLVDRLERAGLVERQPHRDDRRKMLVSLTAQRTPELEAAWEIPGRAFGQALDAFTDEELAVIERCPRRTTEVGGEQAERLPGD
ncbi:MarR family transcriptional regulator [Streptomyces sp. 8K308]|uniref:MarR family winged helix-turn-helix transcriptional regulator n=1 Tax=Streptomyces sp. 8K308 TaxID=2530388 RepID=UPI0010471035|nr:MarR family transcriptional regulator [Streptomyces sp. 8K308]TDC26751.1 MarR family transcriptional regulator [Streptomyces sp. 8K308]